MIVRNEWSGEMFLIQMRGEFSVEEKYRKTGR